MNVQSHICCTIREKDNMLYRIWGSHNENGLSPSNMSIGNIKNAHDHKESTISENAPRTF